jgi:hypothetical protein
VEKERSPSTAVKRSPRMRKKNTRLDLNHDNDR